MRRIYLFLIFTVVNSIAFGQGYNRTAELPSVDADGFYAVMITPDISTNLKEDFSDLRILENEKTEIPYLLKTESPFIGKESFKEYKILTNKHAGKKTTLILENDSLRKINNISIIIRNADVQKSASLSGSDDQKSWYVIKDKYHLEAVYSALQTSEIRILNFPLSDYRYLKLEINDSTSAPLQILKAGYYDIQMENGKYFPVNVKKISQYDSTAIRSTIVQIDFNQPSYIDKININANGPVYFKRNISICKKMESKIGSYYQEISNGFLASNEENTYKINREKYQNLYLIIRNDNNPPLKISAAEAFQLQTKAIAYLEKSKKYSIVFENKEAEYPVYDIKYFQNNIPQNVPAINPVNIKIAETKKMIKSSDFFTNQTWVWAGIIVIILILGFLSYKLINDIKKEN